MHLEYGALSWKIELKNLKIKKKLKKKKWHYDKCFMKLLVIAMFVCWPVPTSIPSSFGKGTIDLLWTMTLTPDLKLL